MRGGFEMKTAEKTRHRDEDIWEKSSGLIGFLSSVSSEVTRFNEATGFNIECIVRLPESIDGRTDSLDKLGFVVARNNRLLPDRIYCLYAVLKERELHGYIGSYRNGKIQTLRELGPISNFVKGKAALYDLLRALLKASCEKI